MTVQLYLGDCLEIMRTLPAGSVDAVVTDPPYGIADVWKGGFGHGWGAASLAAPKRNLWDSEVPKTEVFEEIFRIAKTVIIWGGELF